MDGSLFSSLSHRRLYASSVLTSSVFGCLLLPPYHRPSMTCFQQILFSVCTIVRYIHSHSLSRALWREFVNAPRVVGSVLGSGGGDGADRPYRYWQGINIPFYWGEQRHEIGTPNPSVRQTVSTYDHVDPIRSVE
jgi:hypothetical protein